MKNSIRIAVMSLILLLSTMTSYGEGRHFSHGVWHKHRSRCHTNRYTTNWRRVWFERGSHIQRDTAHDLSRYQRR